MKKSNGTMYKCRWCDEEFALPILRSIHELKHVEQEDKDKKCCTNLKQS